ncbi:MAG: ankyrin repeat domain-containing protein, partial [Pirellulales bacterium]
MPNVAPKILTPEERLLMHPDWFANEQSYEKLPAALLEKYKDKWIAVVDGKIVASGGGGVRPVFEAAAQVHKHPYLVRVGSDLHQHAVDRATVFRAAVWQSDVAAMRQYAAEEPHLFEKLKLRKERIVHDAAKESSPEAVRALIELGADIDEQGSNGFTGLVWAVTRERVDVVQTLLKLGADPNRGCPIFSVACAQKLKDRVAMAKLLLDHGADINHAYLVEDLPPRTVLSEAMAHRHTELIDFLESHGAMLPEKASEEEVRAAESLARCGQSTQRQQPTPGASPMAVSLSMVALGKDAKISGRAICDAWRTRWPGATQPAGTEKKESTFSFHVGEHLVAFGLMP